jgi:hypothetical protein
LLRVSLGRQPGQSFRNSQAGTRKDHNKSIRGSFRDAQSYLRTKLPKRDTGRLPCAVAIGINQFLDQWLTTAVNDRNLIGASDGE